MDSSVNFGGLVGLLNDYPEDMHNLLVEIRDHDAEELLKQASYTVPTLENQPTHCPESSP
ncbi:MAG: hypothetical protein L3J62_09050 [Gammaproteobacteria bacterium]|nr:hypothetical protein [Gammaproteobacteria bacterium]MCF6230919.1 hypothetical protein [Gammaproteobacteria bacterium]